MFIKPSPGLVLRDPVTKQLLPADTPTEVPDDDPFYARRVRDGDVLVLTNPAKTKRSADQ